MKKPKMIKIRITKMDLMDYKQEFYAFKYSPDHYIVWYDENEFPHHVSVKVCEEIPMTLLEQIPEDADGKINIPTGIKSDNTKKENEITYRSDYSFEKALRTRRDFFNIKKITVEF